MLSCREISEFLADYVEGQLPRWQRLTFQLHLALCRDCRRYLASYRRTIKAAASLRPASLAISSSTERASVATANISDTELLDSPEPIPPELVQAILAAREGRRPEPPTSAS